MKTFFHLLIIPQGVFYVAVTFVLWDALWPAILADWNVGERLVFLLLWAVASLIAAMLMDTFNYD